MRRGFIINCEPLSWSSVAEIQSNFICVHLWRTLRCSLQVFILYNLYNKYESMWPYQTRTHTHILLQVILNPPPGRWDSKDNSKVWLYILFTQTSCKLYLSPSSCVLWGSSRSQHPSHFTRPACLSSPLLSGDLHYSPPDLSVSEQWRWTCVTSPQIVCPHTSSLKASKLEQACYARVCCDSLSTGWYNSDAKRKKKNVSPKIIQETLFSCHHKTC